MKKKIQLPTDDYVVFVHSSHISQWDFAARMSEYNDTDLEMLKVPFDLAYVPVTSEQNPACVAAVNVFHALCAYNERYKRMSVCAFCPLGMERTCHEPNSYYSMWWSVANMLLVFTKRLTIPSIATITLANDIRKYAATQIRDAPISPLWQPNPSGKDYYSFNVSYYHRVISDLTDSIPAG